MKNKRYARLISLFILAMNIWAYTQGQNLSFRPGNEIIYRAYKENNAGLEAITNNVRQNLTDIRPGKSVINITSVIPVLQKSNPAAINLASLRGAVVRRWLMDNFPTLSEENFRFGIDSNQGNEYVSVACTDDIGDEQKSKIYFTSDKQNRDKIAEVLSWYKVSPLQADTLQLGEYDWDFVNPDLDPTEITILTGGIDEKVQMTIYFNLNKDYINPDYLSNTRTLRCIDSLLNLKSADYIDTLRIRAFSSPEGPPDYNQKLSERRANSFREYILSNYPRFNPSTVIAQGVGENWDGFRHLAEADPNLPGKPQVLDILNDPTLTLLERQAKIVALDGGRTYKEYIFPNYYPKLRSGASLFIIYNPVMPVDIDFEPIVVTVMDPEPEIIVEPEPGIIEIEEPVYRYIRPFALKSNLLFDAATLFNVELEIPIGKHFSVLGEWTFPFWGGLGNRGGVAPVPAYSEKYTLQMLSGGIEVRYWLPRSKQQDAKAQKWGDYNPLNGWFAGPYIGRGLYDFQFGRDGIQGEIFIAGGISVGFAHPIGKYLHMEYSAGVGYLQTEYKAYTPMDGHKVYKYPGRYTWIGPTKAKLSLIWIPRFRVKDSKGGTKQ